MLIYWAVVLVACTEKAKDQSAEINGLEKSKAGFQLSQNPTYVGNQSCQPCHADVWEKYNLSGKGRAFDIPKKGVGPETFPVKPVYDASNGMYYTAFFRNLNNTPTEEHLIIAEFRLKGKDTTHYREEVAKYVVGSGNQTRSYLRQSNGYLYELPITFYTKKKIWDLSPGYENGANSRFDRKIEPSCLACHTHQIESVPNSGHAYSNIGNAIACESCHGPASNHLSLLKANNNKIEKGNSGLVALDKLPPQIQMDVCRQCHLEGLAVPKKGGNPLNYRPGDSLGKYLDIYIPVTENKDEFGFASHAERLQLSACYLKSKGQLTCTSCHNPHEATPANAAVFYNSKCISCHQQGHESLCVVSDKAQQANKKGCIGCHIAQGGTTDIPHVATHDHYIRRKIASGQTNKAHSAAADPEKVIALKNFLNHGSDNRLGVAWLSFLENHRPSEKLFTEKLNLIAPYTQFMSAEEQVRFYFLKNQLLPKAQVQQLSKEPLGPLSKARLSRIATDTERLRLAVEAATEAPNNLECLFNLATVYGELGQVEEEIATYQKISRLEPTHIRAWANLGYALLEKWQQATQGNAQAIPPVEALTCFRKAIALDPDYVLAYENMLQWHALAGNKTEALKIADQLITQFPKNKNRYKALKQELQRL